MHVKMQMTQGRPEGRNGKPGKKKPDRLRNRTLHAKSDAEAGGGSHSSPSYTHLRLARPGPLSGGSIERGPGELSLISERAPLEIGTHTRLSFQSLRSFPLELDHHNWPSGVERRVVRGMGEGLEVCFDFPRVSTPRAHPLNADFPRHSKA